MKTLAYTPSREPSEVVVARTVGRTDVLARVAEVLSEAASDGVRRHLLLLGPRGSGKSHVLQVARARSAASASEADRLVFSTVPEDAIGYTSVDTVLDRVLSALGERPRDRTGDEQPWSTAERRQRIDELLDGRVAVLVVENLDRVLLGLGPDGRRALRDWIDAASVLLLASTPTMFADPTEDPGHQPDDGAGVPGPWSDLFEVIRLPGLTADEGHQLLVRLATHAGDDELRQFLESDKGRERVRAIAELTGGSPRIWMILREVLTPGSLEALMPAVQELLENLTPYYQQQLWELPPREQGVVRALAEGRASTMSALEIGRAAGDTRGVADLLSRLADNQWVERVEMGEPGQRRSWWSLREPLLRHHFQYRSGDASALTLMVSLLRMAFAPEERRRQLAQAETQTVAFAEVAESFTGEQRRGNTAYAERDVDELQGEARLWQHDTGRWSYAASGRVVDHLVARCRANASTRAELTDLVGRGLSLAAGAEPDPRTRTHLTLLARCWSPAEPARTLAALTALQREVTADDPLGVLVRAEVAACTGAVGDHLMARALYARLVDDQTRTLGPAHPDTLRIRGQHAHETARAGHPAVGRDLLTALVEDQTRVLGRGHPDTLRTRRQIAQEVGRTGRHAAARDLLAELVDDQAAALGRHHPDTLRTRVQHALEVGRLGEHPTARDLLVVLVEEERRAFGDDHLDTLTTRHHHAFQTGESDERSTARDLYAALVEDLTRVLGPDHPDTLRSRHNRGFETGEAGDHVTARALFTDLVADRARVLGRDHADTRRSLLNLAFETEETGEHATARDLYAALLGSAPTPVDEHERRFLILRWARSQCAADPAGSLRAAFGDAATTGNGAALTAPDEGARELLASIALEQALRRGVRTGIALVDLVIEAKRGSREALTRLPEELRNALPLLPEPPARSRFGEPTARLAVPDQRRPRPGA